jgi:hypothetical protein
MSSPYPAYGRQPGANNPYMYPPNGSSVPYSSFDESSSTAHGKYEFASNRISRTPSPTPSEAAELARSSMFDWKAMRSWRFWLRREWLCAFKIFFRSVPLSFEADIPPRVLRVGHHPHYHNPFHHRIPSTNRH